MENLKVYFPETAEKEYEKRLASLNKKLARHSVSVVESSRELKTIGVPVYEVELSIPVLDTGYTYKGTVTFKEGVLSMFGVNGLSLKAFEDIRNNPCSVCNKKHNARTKMFIFEKDNEMVSVGSSCASQYAKFSVDSVYKILGNFFQSNSVEELRQSKMSDHFLTYNTSEVMKVIARAHSDNPSYQKKEYGYTYGTTGVVKDGLNELKKTPSYEFDVDVVLKAKVAKGLLKKFFAEINDENNFLYTLNKTLFVEGSEEMVDEIPQRGVGRLVYAFYSAMKQQKNEIARRKNADKVYLGDLGQKLAVSVKLLETKTFTSNQFSYYGTSSELVRVETDEGQSVSFFTSSNKVLTALSKDTFVEVEGTVKSHQEYGAGNKTTTLNRVKVVKKV